MILNSICSLKHQSLLCSDLSHHPAVISGFVPTLPLQPGAFLETDIGLSPAHRCVWRNGVVCATIRWRFWLHICEHPM